MCQLDEVLFLGALSCVLSGCWDADDVSSGDTWLLDDAFDVTEDATADLDFTDLGVSADLATDDTLPVDMAADPGALPDGDTCDGRCDDHMVMTWRAGSSSGPGIVVIPVVSSGHTYSVDWNNDGAFDEEIERGAAVHDFGRAGEYTIRLGGPIEGVSFAGGVDCTGLLRIEQWGSARWGTMREAFLGCESLEITAMDAPDLSRVKDMTRAFAGASSVSSGLEQWDVSSVESMHEMFRDARSFNGDIRAWDTSSVEDMESMFSGAISFDRPIGAWDVSQVITTRRMFSRASSFDQDLSSWDVSNVRDMHGMFSYATSFNSPLDAWNTSNVEDMDEMFSNALVFDQDLAAWDVGEVESMDSMFRFAASFDRPLGGWDITSVENLAFIFASAPSFDQDLSAWDTSNVKYMNAAFAGAASFDRPLSTWSLDAVVSMDAMLNGSGLSTRAYDETLEAWSDELGPSNVTFGAEGLTYCKAAAARARLMTERRWNIAGDELECNE